MRIKQRWLRRAQHCLMSCLTLQRAEAAPRMLSDQALRSLDKSSSAQVLRPRLSCRCLLCASVPNLQGVCCTGLCTQIKFAQQMPLTCHLLSYLLLLFLLLLFLQRKVCSTASVLRRWCSAGGFDRLQVRRQSLTSQLPSGLFMYLALDCNTYPV